MTMSKKDDRLSHQKSRFFLASKGVGLSLDIWLSRKALEGLLQNMIMMLDLLYHKCNSLITAVLDGSAF